MKGCYVDKEKEGKYERKSVKQKGRERKIEEERQENRRGKREKKKENELCVKNKMRMRYQWPYIK